MTWSSATPMAGRRLDRGHYVELTDFFKKHKVAETMAPATVAGYASIRARAASTGPSRLKATPRACPIARTGLKTRRKKPPSRPNTATSSTCQDLKELGDIAEFFYRPKEKRYGISVYTDNSLRRARDGRRERDLQLRR